MSAATRNDLNSLAQRMMRHFGVDDAHVLEGHDDGDGAAMVVLPGGVCEVWSLGTWKPSMMTMIRAKTTRIERSKTHGE